MFLFLDFESYLSKSKKIILKQTSSAQQVPFCPLFFQPPGKNQTNLVSDLVLQITLNDTFSHISIDHFGLYISLHKSNWTFSQICISLLWLGKFFKFIVFRLLENAFAFKKLKLGIFSPSPWKTSPRVLSSSPRKRIIIHSARNRKEGRKLWRPILKCPLLKFSFLKASNKKMHFLLKGSFGDFEQVIAWWLQLLNFCHYLSLP